MTIAVDFDGTIVEHNYPKIGRELPFAIDALKRLQANGHRIILWTVRDGKYLDEAVEYCRKRGLEFYAVNSEFPDGGWDHNNTAARKIKADIYIDDRQVGGMPDWSTMYDMIMNHITINDILVKAAEGEPLPESFDIYSGTFNRPHRHHHKRSLVSRIISRCRSSRAKVIRK